MEALVSIIIPIYNVSNYMDACILSASAQDYRNIEIILIDDGSTDDSGRKCDSWAKKDHRIRVIHKKNGGLSSARNIGLDTAKGKYIYFLDGDDTIEKNLISSVIPFMEQGKDIVFFRYYLVSSKGEKVPAGFESGEYILNTITDRAHFLTDYILSQRLGWEAWNKIYRGDLIRKYNLRFADNRIIFAEDLYFCLCYCTHAVNVLSINKYLYNYMQRTDSIMAEQSVKLNVGRMNELAKKFLEYLKSTNNCEAIIERFPLIYFMIIDNVFTRARSQLKTSPPEYRKMIYEDVQDVSFMRKWMKEFLKKKKELYLIYGGSRASIKISYLQFLYDGSYFTLRLRNRFINHHIELLDRKSPLEKYKECLIYEFSKNTNCIYYLGSEEYGNLGDHKISEAIKDFSKFYFPKYQFLEITAREFPEYKIYLKKYIKKQDLIFLPGGGNLGDTYPATEGVRQEIISLWGENLKVIFPQTIYFSENAEENILLKNAEKVYTLKKNVILFAREKKSYQLACELFECRSYVTPDIVLFWHEQSEKQQREKIVLFCFRNDKEQIIAETVKDRIKQEAIKVGYVIKNTDLQLPYHVTKAQRKYEIDQKLEEMRKASLVITDRLHGMIFAAITGTPCIVFSNYNHKVKGTYDWISYLSYIKYVENVEEAINILPSLLEVKDCVFDNTSLMKYYDKMACIVKKKIE